MKQLVNGTKWMGMGAVAIVALAGCTPQEEAAVEEGAADTAQTMENAADATGNTATGAADLATITPQVKEALGDNKALEGSSIDVDTDVTGKVVHLKGTVKDDAQKTLAEETAKAELKKINPAGEYTVQNDLTVGAAVPATP